MKLKCMLLVLLAFTLFACKPKEKNHVVVTTLSGKRINFSDLGQHWVVINYWANWCEPCRKEIPELNAFASKHSNVWASRC